MDGALHSRPNRLTTVSKNSTLVRPTNDGTERSDISILGNADAGDSVACVSGLYRWSDRLRLVCQAARPPNYVLGSRRRDRCSGGVGGARNYLGADVGATGRTRGASAFECERVGASVRHDPLDHGADALDLRIESGRPDH